MNQPGKNRGGGAGTAFPPPRGRQPSIEWVPIAELRIDPSYQRSIDTGASQKLIRQIAEQWDWDVLDILKVSRRPDDRLFLVDGQHRRAAAELRGDIAQLPCVLKRCAGAEEEARLFMASNRGRKRMSRIDDFRAALAAGDDDAVVIDRLIAAADLRIAGHEMASRVGPGELINVVGLRNQLRRHGEGPLGGALKLIGEAFPDEVLVAPSAMVGALIELLKGRPSLDPERLFETLLTGTTAQWCEWAGLRAIRAGGWAQIEALRDQIAHRYAGLAVAA